MQKAEIIEIKKEIKELEKNMIKTPYGNPFDKEYRRLWYIRYADDFLIGIIGSKEDATKIKRAIKKYINEELNLNLSEEKSF